MQLRGLFLSEQGVRVRRAEWGLRVWYRLTREASLHYCHGLVSVFFSTWAILPRLLSLWTSRDRMVSDTIKSLVVPEEPTYRDNGEPSKR